MARFHVKIWRDMADDEVYEECEVSASDRVSAAGRALRSIGGGWADWIRVEQQGRDRSVVCFLDSAYGTAFAYEASFRQ